MFPLISLSQKLRMPRGKQTTESWEDHALSLNRMPSHKRSMRIDGLLVQPTRAFFNHLVTWAQDRWIPVSPWANSGNIVGKKSLFKLLKYSETVRINKWMDTVKIVTKHSFRPKNHTHSRIKDTVFHRNMEDFRCRA